MKARKVAGICRRLGRTYAQRAGRGIAQIADLIERVVKFQKERRIRASRRLPASVGATLRVVRLNRRTPSRVSRSRMVWLSGQRG
jgi:hypothetical protein